MAQGASIQTVYETLRDLANKDAQGFVTDAEFNRFAVIAQQNIFNSLFDELKDSLRLSRAGFNPGRDKSRTKRIQEDLAYFSKKQTITKGTDGFDKPDDLSRIIGIYTAGTILLDQSTKKPVEVCYDEEKIERILLNNLSAPTEDFPVALVSEDIQVFPTSVRKIEVRYYKTPEGRTLAGARTTDMPNYSSGSGKVDFELPDHYASDLVYEIGKMIGLNLRDQQIVAYTGQEMQTRKQAETF
tara:strand:+ start:3453 stop:4178 length:726 start_codon:yes stop_codon:yes gene_type:complete